MEEKVLYEPSWTKFTMLSIFLNAYITLGKILDYQA